MPHLLRFLEHFDQNYKIFATKLRFRIRRVVLERVHGSDNRDYMIISIDFHDDYLRTTILIIM